ncbi:hypothetical protein Pla175_18830 [Pirellulimonas nuda]|uniref:PEP-CTERM protein-sorting domain-containing protein n=1 Tax=Pirellulimonas nuda TaxID=2528009 RepID=A0A518DAJ3_9BACT|nr:hypothetical protein [Pirellulimonas nuda]QDU88505.1 hypothetical protein Pla175_18830 [Pirellulimonas nuda]
MTATKLTAFLAATTACMTVGSALAVPYASGVREVSPGSFEFVLNQAASSVTIKRDGGNAVVIPAAAAGRHTFDMTGFSSYEIEVSNNAAAGWAKISDDADPFANWGRITGLEVNKDPSSPYFGTVYVNNPNTTATVAGRAMGDGIYSLTADLQGADLSTIAFTPTLASDTTQAKGADFFTVSGSSNSAYRMSLDDGGNLIIGDWSDANGGIKYLTPNLTGGGLILATQGGPSGGVDSSVSDEFGAIPLHGSIPSRPTTTGTVGVDLVVWAIDEDLDENFSIPQVDYNHLWRWDVGAATDYSLPPTLVVDAGSTDLISFTSQNIDAVYNPQFDKWYLTQPRSDGTESSLTILTVNPSDAAAPTIEFASQDYTAAQGLDGFVDDAAGNPNNDIFRQVGQVAFSPDGTKMYLRRNAIDSPTAVNPYLGLASNLPGQVLVVPLDSSGLPIIQFDDNGTPGDVSDDFISNFESISLTSNASAASRFEIRVDAAGNIYTGNNTSERLEVFSPGGNTLATTTSAGGFSVVALPGGLAGDYNNDGFIDAADYSVWRDNLNTSNVLPNDPTGGVIGQTQYDTWKTNFGQPAVGAAVGSAVPEPAGLVLAGLATLLGCCVRRVRK